MAGLTTYRYRPNSFQSFAFTGLADGSGNPLTNANSLGKWSLTDLVGNTLSGIAGSSMSYAGSGAWTAVLGSGQCPFGMVGIAHWNIYDAAGTTLLWSKSGLLLPLAVPVRTYQRESTMLYTQPFYTAYDGTVRNNTNSYAQITLTDLETNLQILVPTLMNVNTGAQRWEGGSNAGTGANRRFRAQIQVFRTSDNVLYDTWLQDYIDGG